MPDSRSIRDVCPAFNRIFSLLRRRIERPRVKMRVERQSRGFFDRTGWQ